MFPLNTVTLPASAAALQSALSEGLRRIFEVDVDPVSVRDASYPHLAEINVSLDHAALRPQPPRPQLISGKSSPALKVDQLALHAVDLAIGPASVDLSLSARDVDLVQGKDADDELVLSLQNAAEGKIEISTSLADLEKFIAKMAKDEAGKHGVTVENVRLTAREKSAHSLEAEVRLQARKLFMSASIRVTGQLALDDELSAKISGLACKGDGAIAAVACGVLTPHLQKLDGREFPLMSLPLGEVRLRDVRIAVTDKLFVKAEFGSVA